MSKPTSNISRGVLDRIITRLSIAATVAGVLAAAIGASLVATQARGALSEEVASTNSAEAETLAMRIDTRLDALREVLIVAARQPEITDMDAAAEGALRSLLVTTTAFDELVLYDVDGTPVAVAAVKFLPQLEEYASNPGIVESASTGRHVELLDGFPPTLEMAVPVDFPPGTLHGALVARAPLETVAVPLEQANTGTNAIQLLIDQSGRIVVHPSRDLVATEARFRDLTVLEDPSRQAVLTEDDVNWLVAAAPLRSFPGWVILQEEEGEALSPITDQLVNLIVIVVGVTTATVIALVVVGRRQLRPLRPISSAIERLGAGERGVRVDVPAEGELRTLAEQFNSMAESLDRRHDEQASLYRLSLMVTSEADRTSVQRGLVDGAKNLLAADTTALYRTKDDDRLLELELAWGRERNDASLSRVAETAFAKSSPHIESLHDGGCALAVPVTGMEGRGLAALVVAWDDRAPSNEEVRLLETFASFAAVALENAHRLELERALVDELEQTVHSRQDLFRNVTHDLRVPIASMSGFIRRLLDDSSEQTASRREKLLLAVEEQVQDLDDMITKILEFSAPQMGRRPLTIAPVLLRSSVKAALESLGSMIGSRPMENSVPNVTVMADQLALTRTLVHLLSNAVRYSPAGSPVKVRATEDGDVVRVEVIDRGVGIDPASAPRLFEPFWRQSDGHRHGTGLGLTLAAEYVRSMGGEIGVHSDVSEGTRFYFTLPLVDANRDVAGIVQN